MNDEMTNFVNNMGVLCEMWTLTYSRFINQGMSAKDAMMHTQGFMSAIISTFQQNEGGKK